MKNNKALLGILAFSILLLLGTSMVAAIPNGQGKHMRGEKNDFFEQDHEAMRTAIENNDFASWKSLMESRITEDNFNQMVERHSEMKTERETRQKEMQEYHQLMVDGNYEEAEEYMEELMPEENNDKPQKRFFKGFFDRF
jgi:hypothetical protein